MEMPALPRLNGPAAALPDHRVRAIGIDLGTTNSTVAEVVWDPAEPGRTVARCLEVSQPTLEGSYVHVMVPSMVAIHGGKAFVGEGAKRLRAKVADLKLERYRNLFYECKNEMGIDRTYHKAPEGYRSAADIGGKVLAFLKDAALEEGDIAPDRVVVTVPASFQAAQRTDTLRAANLAGLEVRGGDLLDEPIAAFLDYLVTHRDELLPELATPKTLVVFDFGGGTCDIAVFRLEGASEHGGLNVASLSVSRYHRLGGGDIDAAILYEVLIPQLMEQNGLAPFSLSYTDKKHFIEPALLNVAEALKIGLSTEISRLKKFGKYDGAEKSQIVKRLPGSYDCPISKQDLVLTSPQLSAEQFEELLEPFLDEDILFPHGSDYRTTCSIFAPISYALDRCEVEQEDVDYCLLVGGSSLIPQVLEAIREYFPCARVLFFDDAESAQTAVARGAAYHALALAISGHGLIQPVCHDSISLRTSEGSFELIPKGTPLPYPADGGYKVHGGLRVPADATVEPLTLGIEIIATEDGRLLSRRTWSIPGPVRKGDPLILECRYDENQVLHLKMWLGVKGRNDELVCAVDKPLTNVMNPHLKQVAIWELEEALRTGRIPKAEQGTSFAKLAELYGELGHKERALDILRGLLRNPGINRVYVLNNMAHYASELGDHESELKFYMEAIDAGVWEGTWFNLALALRRLNRIDEAVDAVDRAIAINLEAPFLVLRARLAEQQEDEKRRARYLSEALALFGELRDMTDWELHWFISAAGMDNDRNAVKRAKAEQRRRRLGQGRAEDDGDWFLPSFGGDVK